MQQRGWGVQRAAWGRENWGGHLGSGSRAARREGAGPCTACPRSCHTARHSDGTEIGPQGRGVPSAFLGCGFSRTRQRPCEPRAKPSLSTDFGSLALQPWLPLKWGMGKIVPTCQGFGAMDPSKQIHGHTPLKDTKRPRGLGMNLGHNGAAGCLPGSPLQHFPAKCLSFPTCKKGVRPAVGSWQWLLRDRIKGLWGGLTSLWRETRKLLLEKAKTRCLVTHCTSQLGKDRNLLLRSWEAAQGFGSLSVQRCPGQLEMLSSWACQCPGRAAQLSLGCWKELLCGCWVTNELPESPRATSTPRDHGR